MDERTKLLIGEVAVEKLNKSAVIVFGAGGVGSYVIESLARAGVGKITVVDHDVISKSNINRQIFALHSTIGKKKVKAAGDRIKDINSDCVVIEKAELLTPENINEFDLKSYDYVVDAIDMVSSKIALAVYCEENNINIISSMGTGNKLDSSKFIVTDIYKTSVCPLAKVIRYELRKRGVKKLKVIFSTEEPVTKAKPPASISFVPSVAGLMISQEVILDLIK